VKPFWSYLILVSASSCVLALHAYSEEEIWVIRASLYIGWWRIRWSSQSEAATPRKREIWEKSLIKVVIKSHNCKMVNVKRVEIRLSANEEKVGNWVLDPYRAVRRHLVFNRSFIDHAQLADIGVWAEKVFLWSTAHRQTRNERVRSRQSCWETLAAFAACLQSLALQSLLCLRLHRVEALSDAFVWRLSCLFVAYIGPNSRTGRSRKTKIGTEVAHVTHDSDNTLKVKRLKVVSDVLNSQHAKTGGTRQINMKDIVMPEQHRHLANRCEDTVNLGGDVCVATCTGQAVR